MNKNFLLSLLQRYRMTTELLTNTSGVLEDLLSMEKSRYLIYPCDIIDLRGIFRDQFIQDKNPIALFSLRFCEKYFKNYSIFLVLDSQKVGDKKYNYGGITIYPTDILPVDDTLIRVIVNAPAASGYFDQVKALVTEYKMQVECLINNTIPGVDPPVAKMSETKKKYKTAQLVPSIKLKLTPKEEEIFDYIIAVKKAYNLSTRLLVAGGWVRDKLLGKQSKDIDIAVSMSGFQLAQAMEQAAKYYSIEGIGVPYDTSMDKNADPDQRDRSSELLVGTVDIFGIEVEFVPMRKEEYDTNEGEQSRRPDVEFIADPKVDAERRDLTINALFYDIEEGNVYDYVGGVNDLGLGGNGIYLRTPLDPLKTFKDDPLRVLRVLRFHSRYPGSVIDENVLQAMGDPKVHEAYKAKVKTSRAGPEIMKTLMGDNPVDSLRILFESGLYKTVFNLGDVHPDGMMMDQDSPYHEKNLLDHTLQVVANLNRIMEENGESPKMRGVLNLAALFHDFGKMRVGKPDPKGRGHTVYHGHEDESVKMADEIMTSLGFEQSDKEIARLVIEAHMDKVLRDPRATNKSIGKLIRKSRPQGKEDKYKDLWKYMLYHAQADSMSSRPQDYKPEERQQVYDKFQNYVNMPAAQSAGTVLDGKQIMGLFPQYKPNTGFIEVVKNWLREWQDEGQIDISLAPEQAQAQALQLLQQNQAVVIQDIENNIKTKGTTAMNWYKKIVKAQSIPAGTCGCPEDPEVVKGPKIQPHRYRKGQRVRDRRKGMANPQDFGIIDKVEGNKVTIVWNPDHKDKRKETFDAVEGTAFLSLIVAEV